MFFEIARKTLNLSISEFKLKFKDYEFVDCSTMKYSKIVKLHIDNFDLLCFFKEKCFMCVVIIGHSFMSFSELRNSLDEKLSHTTIHEISYWIDGEILIKLEDYDNNNHVIFTKNEFIYSKGTQIPPSANH